MSLTGGRRLTAFLRPPSGTPVGAMAVVDDDGFVAWLIGFGMVPTYIAPTETFTVPADRQALYTVTIDNEGTIDVIGTLAAVT